MSDVEPSPPKIDLLSRLEHLEHWWREPLAGFVAVGVGCYDVWFYGRDNGFSASLDEILILTGITLIAGVRNLFGAKAPPTNGEPH